MDETALRAFGAGRPSTAGEVLEAAEVLEQAAGRVGVLVEAVVGGIFNDEAEDTPGALLEGVMATHDALIELLPFVTRLLDAVDAVGGGAALPGGGITLTLPPSAPASPLAPPAAVPAAAGSSMHGDLFDLFGAQPPTSAAAPAPHSSTAPAAPGAPGASGSSGELFSDVLI